MYELIKDISSAKPSEMLVYRALQPHCPLSPFTTLNIQLEPIYIPVAMVEAQPILAKASQGPRDS